MTKNNHRYTVDLTRLINSRIADKEEIKKLGQDVFQLNLKIGKIKTHLANTEKAIDDTVKEFKFGQNG